MIDGTGTAIETSETSAIDAKGRATDRSSSGIARAGGIDPPTGSEIAIVGLRRRRDDALSPRRHEIRGMLPANIRENWTSCEDVATRETGHYRPARPRPIRPRTAGYRSLVEASAAVDAAEATLTTAVEGGVYTTTNGRMSIRGVGPASEDASGTIATATLTDETTDGMSIEGSSERNENGRLRGTSGSGSPVGPINGARPVQ